jgi:hypothetical protein
LDASTISGRHSLAKLSEIRDLHSGRHWRRTVFSRQFIDRSVVYDTARSLNLALCIVTGGIRRFANVLLTVGVLGVTPGVEGAEPRRRNQDEDMTKLVTPTKRTGGKGSWLLAAHSHCHYGMIAMFAREKNG